MKVKWYFSVPVLVLIFLTGAFGLKNLEDCGEPMSDTEKMECYHLAAMSLAYTGVKSQAITACYAITYDVGARHSDDDLGKKAEVERNNCLYDIAKITRDPSICGGIDESSLGWAIHGSAVTKDLCYDQVERLASINFDDYHENGICVIVAIIPLLLGAALFNQKNCP